MPKFGEGALGTKFGYQIDKTDGIVGFDDKTHTYFDLNSGEKYISVTQLVSKYEQPFDEDFWSSYKALEALLDGDIWGITKTSLLATKKFDYKLVNKLGVNEKDFYTKKEEILSEYARKRNEACEHGTQVHLSKELAAYRDGGKFIKPFGVSGNFICNPGDYDINPEHGMYPEVLISWRFPNGLCISGQVDLLICDDYKATIVDYKSNAEIKMKSYYNKSTKKSVMMKYPMHNYMDTNYYHYQCQLSLYMYLLQQKYPQLQCKKLSLLHIDREGKETEYPVEYIKDDIAHLINHYAKSLRTEAALAKDNPIKY